MKNNFIRIDEIIICIVILIISAVLMFSEGGTRPGTDLGAIHQRDCFGVQRELADAVESYNGANNVLMKDLDIDLL